MFRRKYNVALYTLTGAVYINVSPYPARVYQNAPPGVYVLKVVAYNNDTGRPVTSFKLDQQSDAEYFRVTNESLVETAKVINKPLDYVFQFFVFAISVEEVNVLRV